MPWKQYLRCPCCGKLASGYAIGHAGMHRLEVRQCVKALGYRYGFVWDRKPLTGDFVGALVRGLSKALVQVLAVARAPAELLALAEPDLAAALQQVRAIIGRRDVAPSPSYAVAPTTSAAAVAMTRPAAEVRGYQVVGEYHPKERAA